MIQINVRPWHAVGPEDELGRTHCGWSAESSPDEVYEATRGCWRFGPRADPETFAVIVHRRLVRCVIEIDHLVHVYTGRRAIVGRALVVGHPFHDRWIDQLAPSNAGGGPFTYVEDNVLPAST